MAHVGISDGAQFHALARFSATWTDLSVGRENDDTPVAFELGQNYPNPFNPATSIAFTLKAPGHVRLTVFDTLGRAVATVLDGVRPAGTHEVGFDASSLPSGLYLYRMEAGGQAVSRSMTLIK